MSNIEEDIKTMHKIISFYRDLDIINNNDKCEEIKAIENILAEREQDEKRIKELEEENRIFKDSNVLVNRYFKLKDNSIPVQKVKDKKEELKKEYEIELEENSTKAFILKCKISALEELLEENNK